MTKTSTKRLLNNHYRDNEERYFQEHAGEYVLLKLLNDGNIEIAFCSDKDVLREEMEESEKRCSLIKKLPNVGTHRYNNGNIRGEDFNRDLEICPNDPRRESRLVLDIFYSGPRIAEHLERVVCKDCGYTTTRLKKELPN
jgi:hypothetical protein